MAELGNYRVDSDLCAEGVWCLYAEDIEFRIARITTPKYLQYLQKLQQGEGGSTVGGSRISRSKRIRKALGKIDEGDDLRDIIDLAVSHHILLGWRNLQIDGEEIEYSQEKAFELLQNPEFQDLRQFVLEQASDAALFLKEEMDEAEGN